MPITDDEAVSLYTNTSLSVEEVVQQTGRSQRTLSRLAAERGQSRPILGGSRPLKRQRNIQQVLALHEEGKTVYEIAESLPEKVNPRTIGLWLQDEGKRAKYVADEERQVVQSGRLQTRALVVQDVRDGMQVTEAAEKHGVNKTSAYRWVKEEGIETHTNVRHERARSDERRQKAADLYRQGVPMAKIREELKCDYYVLRDLLRQAGLLEAGEGRECACGNVIESKNAMYCSPRCRRDYGAKRQADPAKQVTFNCDTCGKEVTRWAGYGASISGMRFCDNACAKKHTKKVRHYVVRESDMVLDSTWEMLFAGLCGFLKIPIERYKRERGVEWAPGRWYAPDFLLPTLDIAVEIKGVEDDEDPQRWITFGQHPDTPWLLRIGRADLERMRKADILTAVLDDIKHEQEMRPKS